MTSPEDKSGRGQLVPAIQTDHQDELTGLPGLPKWRHVYLFVLACFVLSVLLLLALTAFYS
ncbi:MAG TPA: hypothetical protein VMF08_09660 [Candidatus Sulfotelmatobacter sp.]|nr:hypothetical protein [Candidatus Sulfotelmatobacter sp.]